MISLNHERGRFNFRVAGVAFSGDRVLMNKIEGQKNWYLPGGRAEVTEASDESLVRELREELGIEIKVDRLLWVIENFYEYAGTPRHELGMYFLIRIPEDSGIHERTDAWTRDDNGMTLVFKWMEPDELETERLYPSFIGSTLKSIPVSIEHIVSKHVSAPEVAVP